MSSFINDVTRIGSSDYIPTFQDILHTRVRTTGIEVASSPLTPLDIHLATSRLPSLPPNTNFKDIQFEAFDVGGSRTERKRWRHVFEALSCVMFVVALSDYDMTLREAVGVNRMAESIQVFDELCNSSWFDYCSFVLFFNKEDVFREKIEQVRLNVCFKDYSGKMEYKECMDFIINKYLERNVKNRKVHVHVGCATNTESMADVINVVRGDTLRHFIFASELNVN
jgi:guanine nucleotide-binding protein G(i) subunit alpha